MNISKLEMDVSEEGYPYFVVPKQLHAAHTTFVNRLEDVIWDLTTDHGHQAHNDIMFSLFRQFYDINIDDSVLGFTIGHPTAYERQTIPEIT